MASRCRLAVAVLGFGTAFSPSSARAEEPGDTKVAAARVEDAPERPAVVGAEPRAPLIRVPEGRTVYGDTREADRSPPLRTIGLVVGAAGLAGLGASAYFGFHAISSNRESMRDCLGNECGPSGLARRNEATAAATMATVTLIGGALLVLTGTTFVLFSNEPEKTPAGGASVRVSPQLGASDFGVVIRGAY